MERPADTVFNSCGHCFCSQCSELSTCPKCLQDVAGKTRVFGPARMLADMLCRQLDKPLEGEEARPQGYEAGWRQAGPCLGWAPVLVDAAQEGASSADADSPAKRGGAKRAQEHVAMGAAASQPLAHCPRPCKRVRVKHGCDAWVRALDAEVFSL